MENIDEKIEEIKSKKYDEEAVKESLKKVQRYLKKLAGDYKSEDSSIEEIKEEALKELQQNLFAVPNNGLKVYDLSTKYRTVKELLKMEKRDNTKFKKVLNQAKILEENNPEQPLHLSLDLEKLKLTLVRNVIRSCKIKNNKDISTALHNGKGLTAVEIKDEQKAVLEAVFSGLETYGIIDEYIDKANLVLKKEKLGSLAFSKKIGLADDFSKDMDEIGLYDVLDKKFLKTMCVEDINLFSAFWQSKFFQNMQEIYTGLDIVNNLNLWQEVIDGNEEDIDKMDMKKITTVIQKARMKMALSDAIKPEEEIPEELQKEYNKFLQEEGLQGEDLEEELRKTRTETGALSNILTNIIAMQSTIIQDLKSNNMRINGWGKIEEDDEFILVAINNPDFIGPTTMQLNKDLLEDWLSKIGNRQLPEYKKGINQKYSDISNVYMPALPEFNRKKKKAELKKKPHTKGVLDYLR